MAEPLRVSTMLTARERLSVDAVGIGGVYDVLHRDSLDEVMGDVRTRRARAVVLSVARCEASDVAPVEGRIAGIIRDFPLVTTVALLTAVGGGTPAAMLLLGRSGVRTVVDTRSPDGWRLLRDVLMVRSGTVPAIESLAATQLATDLGDATCDCRRLFLTLFTPQGAVATVQQLAELFALVPTTLISRFRRRALPSPKVYLSWARFVRAAALLENPGMSLSAAVTALDYSSPQSFTRHLGLQLGLTVPTFRRTLTGRSMLNRFREELVLAHRARLEGFRPIDGPCRWVRDGSSDTAGETCALPPT